MNSALFDVVERLLLAKEKALIKHLVNISNFGLGKCGEIAENVINGLYLKTINHFEGTRLEKRLLLSYCTSISDASENMRDAVETYIFDGDVEYRKSRLLDCLVLGVAYLEIFCQVNYTGPELPLASLNELDDTNIHAICTQLLECDGTYAFGISEIPQALFIARSILSTIADPIRADWKHGIELNQDGLINKSLRTGPVRGDINDLIKSLPSIYWWNARATITHLRLLQRQTYDNVPTLWKECQDMYSKVLHTFCGINEKTCVTTHSLLTSVENENETSESGPIAKVTVTITASCAQEPPPNLLQFIDVQQQKSDLVAVQEEIIAAWHPIHQRLAAQAWLEWGLCCQYFSFGDKGKRCFQNAKEAAGLVTELAASLGKRTKHQHTDYAQLYLYAKSSLVQVPQCTVASTANQDTTDVDTAAAAVAVVVSTSPQTATVTDTKPSAALTTIDESADHLSYSNTKENEDVDSSSSNSNSNAWQHSEWEMGRRLVREGAGGEEAAVREVMLDSVDGGATENIILEGGPVFTSTAATVATTTTAAAVTATVGVDNGGALHPLDQAIILALCLDVSNSNPVDGLTNEEMQPYVERVLQQAANWMIHSTALLERSWLEFERRKTMDRAMLQIQALIDQHTTKLTMMQSTYQSIEDSAPAEDRMQYLYSIVYPAQYELKRDLAIRYLRCQVFVSALNYFRELEMWDEVVTCYQLMQKPHRAELVVREQLAKTGETPYMLTSLADLTKKETYYEQAWLLSKGRFPRAMRTLGKICYDRGEYAQCVIHLDAALSVHPLVATAWYLKGIACMRLERWEESLQAFVRCVQQDMEIGEAWANIGAINMRLRSWAKAHGALVEALRHKQDSWRIRENLMMVTLSMGRWKEVVRHMTSLLDMRRNSERPVHKDELRHLAYIVSSQAQREARIQAKNASNSKDSENNSSVVASPAAIVSSNSNSNWKETLRCLIAKNSCDGSEEEEEDEDIIEVSSPLPDLAECVQQLLNKITTTIPSDADIWDICAEYQHTLGKWRLKLDCRTKQFRALSLVPSWEKHSDKIESLLAAAVLFVQSHYFEDVKKTDLYAAKMLLQTAQRKIESAIVAAGAAECTVEEKAVASLKQLIIRLGTAHDSV